MNDGRIFITIFSYLLSGYGFVLMALIVRSTNVKSSMAALFLAFSWLVPWAVHLMLSWNHIIDVRLGKRWAIGGTCSAIYGLLAWPICSIVLNENRTPFNEMVTTPNLYTGLGLTVLIQLAVVLPCALLAIYLVAYHWKGDSQYQQKAKQHS